MRIFKTGHKTDFVHVWYRVILGNTAYYCEFHPYNPEMANGVFVTKANPDGSNFPYHERVNGYGPNPALFGLE